MYIYIFKGEALKMIYKQISKLRKKKKKAKPNQRFKTMSNDL